jgi:protein-disulfide isomerase
MLGQDKLIRSKTSFFLGLASGIAAISFIGFLLFLGLYLKAQFSDGGFNNDGDSGAIVDNNDSGAKAQPSNGDSGAKADIKISKDDHIRGNKNAKITIVEYSDIQCPFCSRFHETMLQVMKNYPDKVRWVFRHFPLESIHPYARKAAEAAECAGEQGKFWEYTDKLYANQASLNTEYLSTAAEEVGLNTSKFDSCLSSGRMAARVSADLQQGQNLGVKGTPGSFINGKSVPGAVPYSTLEGMIKAELN